MESRISEIVKTETVTRHSLSSGGSSLTEEVEETIVRPLGSDDILSKSTTIKRTIDDKTMTFKTLADGSEEEEEENSSLTREEKEIFIERWKELWKPSASREELIEALIEDANEKNF